MSRKKVFALFAFQNFQKYIKASNLNKSFYKLFQIVKWGFSVLGGYTQNQFRSLYALLNAIWKDPSQKKNENWDCFWKSAWQMCPFGVLLVTKYSATTYACSQFNCWFFSQYMCKQFNWRAIGISLKNLPKIDTSLDDIRPML